MNEQMERQSLYQDRWKGRVCIKTDGKAEFVLRQMERQSGKAFIFI